MKKLLLTLVVLGAIGAAAGAYYMRRTTGEVQVNTLPVTRGEIIDAVGATGTLQAVTTVQVGTQVSGTIQDLYADFNSIVRRGQVVARLDPSLLQAQVEQSRANLIRSEADLERNRVALTDAQQKYDRARELAARNLVPQSELDAAKTTVDSAKAALQSSEASVSQARASLNQSQVNLEHAVITSPIDGIVIQRSVDVGQTVAASMQAPTLFVIAADLTKMQVNASVDEADVGRIRPGQHVTFRVDAYPAEDFIGTVSQVRLQPVVVQNVTTYGTIIDVPNDELKLKPGMTANLKIEIAKRSEALRIPNASLRFRPTADTFAALNQALPPELEGGGRGGRGGAPSGGGPAASAGTARTAPAQAAAPEPAAPRPAVPDGEAGAAPSGAGPAAGAEPGAPPSGSGRRGGGRRGRNGGGQDPAAVQAQMLERFRSMTPDEQRQFIDRMRGRGQDVSAFETLLAASSPKPATAQGAGTIDALFAPLAPVESQGRAWVYMDKQIKAVRLRLGVTDGNNTEVLSGELQPGMEVVTSIMLPGATTPAPGGQNSGNPLMPGGGRGGFRGGGGRGR
jgi:HlyD family secretion protein